MGLSTLLPWQIFVLILIVGGAYILLFAKSLWRAGNKILATSFILLAMIGFAFGLDYLYAGLNSGRQLIPTKMFDILFTLFIILLFVGGYNKLKKEDDPTKLKKATKFTIVSAIIMFVLFILYIWSLS
jgi:hypothetical protein